MRVNPYLHIGAERIYNPLSDRALVAGEDGFARLRAFIDGRVEGDDALIAGGIVGDVAAQSIIDVLEGAEMAKMRRWTYGVEEAPDDFICRTYIFAIQRN